LDENQFGSALLSIIKNKYDGGIAQFNKDNGAISEVDDSTCLLYVPEGKVSDKFFDSLKELEKSTGKQVVILPKRNFEGKNTPENSDDLKQEISEVINDINAKLNLKGLLVSVNPLLLAIAVHPDDYDKATPEVMKEMGEILVGRLKGLTYGAIYSSTVYKFSGDACQEIQKETKQVIQEIEPERNPITDDDILNLRIALSQKLDVLDVINQL
jgi:hypothetical protein